MKVGLWSTSSIVEGLGSVLAKAGIGEGQDPVLDGGHSSIDTRIRISGASDAPRCDSNYDRLSVDGGNHWT